MNSINIHRKALSITLTLVAALMPVTSMMADDYETLKTEKIQNPMLWADVPDPDIIRVGDTFYLVSTTMHLMPGAPIMKSKDLKNWETVGYIFDRLTDSPKYDLQEGTAYGRGQWATSLKYHKGRFYALLAPMPSWHQTSRGQWATPIFLQQKKQKVLGQFSLVCATSTIVLYFSTMTIVSMWCMVQAR